MIGVVYLGSNPEVQERLKHVPGQLVRFTKTYKDAELVCTPRLIKEHFIIFYQRSERNEDITAITYLKKHCRNIYIILLTDKLSEKERKIYQNCGINDTLNKDASITDINKKIRFISDREGMLFDTEKQKTKILQFKIPIWKRLFDIIVSIISIIVFSPIFLITAIAIKLESKGPVLFKSKRVGTNYTIFDFLKFRSMYIDAEDKLKELSKENNQYAMHNQGASQKVSTNETNKQESQNPQDDSNILIDDSEVMLVGDDFVVAESQFNEQKKEDINNSFIKIENDPRITKVGRFIRKTSIDELPQLFNVLKGDMSIVGNRPLPLYEAEKLTEDNYIDRFMAPAGLTGLWQVEERGHGGMMSAEERKQLDIQYGQTYNFMLDMKIIFRTFFAFLQKDNV